MWRNSNREIEQWRRTPNDHHDNVAVRPRETVNVASVSASYAWQLTSARSGWERTLPSHPMAVTLTDESLASTNL
jgi:hypothetical protein